MRRLAVSAFLGVAFLAMAASPAFAAGDAVFKDKNCSSCHYTTGPAQEKSIADQLAKKGPELWYAGSKFKKTWLLAWLQDPKPIRPMKYNSITAKNGGDHPKLSAVDAAGVTDFLMGLTSADVEAGLITPKYKPKAKLIFNKKMPCLGCHKSPDKKGNVSGGLSGPSLVGASKRLNPDWIYAYLSKTTTFKPYRDMPDFASYLSESKMKLLAAYVANFK
ncbi:MAG: c-type cytochrome [Mariprofundus sp.]|nr:c-type cytochrome [Mariprofundus sp.]